MIDAFARPSLWDRMLIVQHQMRLCGEDGDVDGEWSWSERAECILEELCSEDEPTP